jgi:hypothetical protein
MPSRNGPKLKLTLEQESGTVRQKNALLAKEENNMHHTVER